MKPRKARAYYATKEQLADEFPTVHHAAIGKEPDGALPISDEDAAAIAAARRAHRQPRALRPDAAPPDPEGVSVDTLALIQALEAQQAKDCERIATLEAVIQSIYEKMKEEAQ